jgi:phosphinothricin acetyltransferase
MPRTIRLAEPRDTAAVLDIYRPIVLETAISFETEVPTVEDMASRIADTLSTYPWLVCERDGEIVGYAYACQHRSRAAYRWSPEVSAYVSAASRRCGAGRALYSRLFDCLRLQGFANAFAGITLPNPHSVAFHEAMGFQPIGTFPKIGYKSGAWHDTGWWSLRLIEGTGSPEEPLPLRECRAEIEPLLREDRD